MAIQLEGEVGRSGRPEDVAVVQAVLANIKGKDGRPFWDRPVDGRPGEALAGAIEAFQRRWVQGDVAGGSMESGAVRPGSRTLAALSLQAPRSLDGLKAASVSPVVLYAQDDPAGRAGRGRAEDAELPGATAQNLTAIQRAQALLLQRRRLAVRIGRSGLAGDRWGFQVVIDGLTVIGTAGRTRVLDAGRDAVPAPLWRLVDDEFAGLFEAGGGGGELSGPGVYRSRTALESLRGDIDEAVFPRMEVPRPARYQTARLASAALVLLGRSERLSAGQRDELRQLIAMVKADEPTTARLLEERWRVMQYGVTPATLRYATNEQIRDYLKQNAEWEGAAAVAGLLGLVVATGYGGPSAWVSALVDVLVDGAEDNARRLYEERLKAAALGGSTVAGQSVPPGRSRQEHLFGLFDVALADLEREYPGRFPVSGGTAARARWLGRLLDLMERILAEGRNGLRLRDEIDREWLVDANGAVLSNYVALKLRRVLTLVVQRTDPVNARFRSDPVLAKYRRRLAAIKGIKDRVSFVLLLKDTRKIDLRHPLKRSNFATLASWCKWAAEEYKDVFPRAREELMRRENAL